MLCRKQIRMYFFVTSLLTIVCALTQAQTASGDTTTTTCLDPSASGRRICGFVRITMGAFYHHLKSWEYREPMDPWPLDDASLLGEDISKGTYGGLLPAAGIELGMITHSGIGFGPFVYSNLMRSVERLSGNGEDGKVGCFSGGLMLFYYPGGVQNRFYLLTKFGAASIGTNIYSSRLSGPLLGAGMGVDIFSRSYFHLGLQADVYVIQASRYEAGDVATHDYRQRLICPGLSVTVGFW